MSAEREILAVENLSVQLPSAGGTVRAVQGVSLRVERGQTLALVGESGSGKSLLCRGIMGLLPARAVVGGRVRFLGRDLALLRGKELNRVRGSEIGIVLQNPMSSLNPVLTVGRQIVEPMLHHLRLSKGEARGRALELLDAVGIPRARELFDAYPHQLSGGMRQRVAIAIALSCDPKLLLADEPTTALDVTVQAEILNLLARLQKERDMAMILVTHDLGVVAGRAHETAVMYAGRIVEQAPTAALFDHPRMWYTQGLLASVPRLDAPPGAPLTGIEGAPPNLAQLPPGCSFAPRCGSSEPRCHRELPPLLPGATEAGHYYACWSPCGADHASEAGEVAAAPLPVTPGAPDNDPACDSTGTFDGRWGAPVPVLPR